MPYASPIWHEYRVYQKEICEDPKINGSKNNDRLWEISAETVLVIARIIPIEVKAKERRRLSKNTDGQNKRREEREMTMQEWMQMCINTTKVKRTRKVLQNLQIWKERNQQLGY